MYKYNIHPENLNWVKKPVTGLVLLSAERDSNGKDINPFKFYNVAKHIPDGKVIIEEAI